MSAVGSRRRYFRRGGTSLIGGRAGAGRGLDVLGALRWRLKRAQIREAGGVAARGRSGMRRRGRRQLDPAEFAPLMPQGMDACHV